MYALGAWERSEKGKERDWYETECLIPIRPTELPLLPLILLEYCYGCTAVLGSNDISTGVMAVSPTAVACTASTAVACDGRGHHTSDCHFPGRGTYDGCLATSDCYFKQMSDR